MAQESPDFLDVTDIQFKLHNKIKLFTSNPNFSPINANLLAAASVFGVIFVGSSVSPELKVILLDEVINKSDDKISCRTVSLPSVPISLAVSCDHSLLAVNYTQNGSTFISIYSVPTFLSNNVGLTHHNVVLSQELNVNVVELLWNPTMANTLAICLDNGALIMLNLNDQGGYELFQIDKSEQVRCASWSPKGKQIVVGFSNGKLAQYKPNLQLAKTIQCPPNIFADHFDVVAVQWLSTYQFAAVFIAREKQLFGFFIINAPKNTPPTYTLYEDICFIQWSDDRKIKFYLEHILPWNLILVTNSYSLEVGVLGTQDAGETPQWTQYTLLDEARVECPLTADKQDTFPMGMSLEIGSTHRLTINDTEMPIMPMLHLLTTEGMLVSYDIVNFRANCPGICSTPRPLSDTSGLCHFHLLPKQSQAINSSAGGSTAPIAAATTPAISAAPTIKQSQHDVTFAVPGNATTSTPTSQKFGFPAQTTTGPAKVATNLFGTTTDVDKKSIFGGGGGVPVGDNSQISQTQQTNSAFSSITKTDQQSLAFSAAPTSTATQQSGAFSFSGGGNVFGGGVSNNTTPAFGNTSLFGSTTNQTPLFGNSTINQTSQIGNSTLTSQNNETPPPKFTGGNNFSPQQQQPAPPPPVTQQTINQNKPLITIPPNYTPDDHQQQPNQLKPTTKTQTNKTRTNNNNNVAGGGGGSGQDLTDDDNFIRKLIAEEIHSFHQVLRDNIKKSRNINIEIGTNSEMALATKQLNELQDITNQATESTEALTSEIQSLRLSLNEAFSMSMEAESKHSLFQNVDIAQLRDTSSSTMSQTNRRQLEKLQKQLAINENQYHIVNKQIDAHWSTHQDNVKQMRKAKMHIPKLDNVYMTVSMQREVLNVQKQKIAGIKKKLGYKILSTQKKPSCDVTISSLSDSMFSMSLCDQVKMDTEKLTADKLTKLREALQARTDVPIVRPQRPSKKGINSEVILEKKLAQAKKIAALKIEKEQKKAIENEKKALMPQLQQVKAKPTTAFGNALQQTTPTTHQVQSSLDLSSNSPLQKSNSQKSLQPPPFGGNNTIAETLSTSKPSISTGFAFNLPPTSASAPFANLMKSTPTVPSSVATNPMASSTAGPPPPFSGFGTKTASPFNPNNGNNLPAFGFASSTGGPAPMFKATSGINASNVGGGISAGGSSFTFGASTTSPSSLSTNNPNTTTIKQAASISSPTVTALLTKPIPPNNVPAIVAKLPPATTITAVVETPQSKPITQSDKENMPNPITMPVKPIQSGASQQQQQQQIMTNPSQLPTFNAGQQISFGSKPPASLTNIFGGNDAGGNSFASMLTSAANAAISTIKTTTTPAQTSMFSLSGTKPITSSINAAPNVIAPSGSGTAGTFNFSLGTTIVPTTTPPSAAVATTATPAILPLPTANMPTTLKPTTTSSITTGIVSVSEPKTANATTPTATPTAPSTVTTPAAIAKNPEPNLFQSLNICSPTTNNTTADNSALPAPTSGTNIFSMSTFTSPKSSNTSTASSIFGSLPSNTTATAAATPSPFGGSAASPATPPSATGIFAAAAANAPIGAKSAFGSFSMPTSIASPALTTPNSIFGGAAVNKPEQSIFASPAATATSATLPAKSIFGGTNSPNVSTSGIFGSTAAAATVPSSSAFGFGAAAASLFGGNTAPGTVAAVPSTQPTGNIFGAAAASLPFGAATTTKPNIFGQQANTQQTTFGTPQSPTSSSSGTSLFGGSSAFGASPNNAQQQPQTASSIFGGGSTGAATGNALAPSAFGQSVFSSGGGGGVGGGAGTSIFATQQTSTPFSGGTGTFGSPSNVPQGFGSPNSGVASLAVSPNASGSAAGAFGAAPAFGSPSFGGAATFGSPKGGFGSTTFGQTAAAPSAFSGQVTQKNSLFESLGSSETGMTFGNIAQSSNTNPTNPSFSGGSSFSSWR